MLSRDYRDIVTGAVLTLAGLIYAGYTAAKYDTGSISEMGPGMFPLGLGLMLAGFGVVIALPALRRVGEPVEVEWRQAVAVVASIVVFGLLIRPFGLVPAVIALTLVATLGDDKLGLRGALLLAAGVTAMAALIFVIGLGMLIPLVRWPL
jgi:hypothetical protein